ncbi:MAG: hypothetical protein AAFZ65_07385 [Planctomycetota bacterium]
MRLLSAILAAPILAIGLATSADAQVGERLPEGVELKDFAQCGAESLEDLRGRAVLIEFFAYW